MTSLANKNVINQTGVRNEYPNLAEVCKMDIDDFRKFGDVIKETVHGPLIFQDNGANILGVGHLDHVKFTTPGRLKAKPNNFYCGQLDDRLGVYCLLSPLKKYNQMPKFDILLTDSEETGNSTAQFFVPPRQYNWIFELDRAGDDVVTYGYGKDGWDEILEAEGFDVFHGAFSDISAMEDCKCKAANWGIGYHQAHSNACYADLRDTKKNLLAFTKFAIKYHETHFEHESHSKQFGFCRYNNRNYNDLWKEKEKDKKKEQEKEENDVIVGENIESDSPHYYDVDEQNSSSWQNLYKCKDCQSDLQNDFLFCPYCGLELLN